MSMVLDSQVLRAQRRVGSTVRDKWLLDRLLGVGGMASVYAATHRNGSRAAVKILHPEISTNAAACERFMWEGHVANAVRHDGVVKVIDDDIDEDGTLYLVAELLDGETLEERRLRHGGRISEEECLLVSDQLLGVLVAAHAAEIVHRNIKPDNVFLTREGQVKLLDFGIARLRESSASKHITPVGTALGTPAYMAPEQARGLSDEVDARSDIWACGATMFCLLSGQTVHDGHTDREQLVNAVTRPARSLRAVAPDVSDSVAQLVDRALEFSANDRWPTAARMREALQHVYEEQYARPITTAPGLVLSDRAAEGTPPQPLGAVAPSDERAATPPRLEDSSFRPTVRSYAPRRKTATVAAGAAVGLVVAVLSIVAVMGVVERRTRTSSTLGVAATASPSAAGVLNIERARPSPAEVSVTDLPIAGTASSLRGAAAAPLPQPPGPPSAGVPRPDTTPRRACRPPYFVDPATGKMHWKLECL
jgi:serine/threonine-protein kinase